MVAIFTGAGTGFERGSGNVLGGAGLLGQAALGRSGEQLLLNAANGNLMVMQQDELLLGRGPDAAISRTYNSLGDLSDENGDNWRQSTDRRVFGLTGTVNVAGSTIKRVSADGSVITYSYNGTNYRASDGAGAHDTLTYSAATGWSWTDGDSQVVETYGYAFGGQSYITQQRDPSGNALTFSYTDGRLTELRTANGERIQYGWSGSAITDIRSYSQAAGGERMQTRTRYAYDSLGRLSSATIDLTPEDNSVADGRTYVSSYGYVGDTRLIASIAQTDGTRVDFEYDGSQRVLTVTQTVDDATTRVTRLSYGADNTVITDPAGQTTRLDFAGGDFALRGAEWGNVNVATQPATINGVSATRYTVQTSGNVANLSQGFTVAAGETIAFAVDLQAVGTDTTQYLGLYSGQNEWGTTGGSVARIVSGPGTVELVGGGLWRVVGLSATEGTRVEVMRTFDKAGTGGAYFYIDQGSNYRAGASLIAGGQTLVRSTTASSLDRMNATKWTGTNLTRTADTAINGATAYKFTVKTATSVANLQRNFTAKAGETYSFAITLKATGTYQGHHLGLGGTTDNWGPDALSSARIVSGPGALDPITGGFFSVRDLSTTEPTTIILTRTYARDQSGYARLFVALGADEPAGSGVIVSGLNIVGPVGQPEIAQQLTRITAPPAVAGGAQQVTQFTYNANGDVATVTDPGGAVTKMSYDGSGNLLTTTDRLGNVVTRTYDARNQLLRTSATAVAGDGAELVSANNVYDSVGRLRYAITAERSVTRYSYNATGQLIRTDSFTGNTLPATTSATETELTKWVAALPDKSARMVVRYEYDARGEVSRIVRDGAVDAAGEPTAAQGYAETVFVRDASGRLLERITGGQREVFVYDGLGRMIASTDIRGGRTSMAFDDAGARTVVTSASGAVETSTYNRAGDLIATSETGAYSGTGSASYRYDRSGRPRIVTDAFGNNRYAVYDQLGRKTGDIDHLGRLTEYRYDANDRLVATIGWSKALTAEQLARLGNPATDIDIAILRPGAAAGDSWNWTVYDREGRVVQRIDATGASIVYDYDATGRLLKETRFSNRLTVDAFKTTLPTALTRPTADAARDIVARNFYDRDGKLTGVLDGEGYLTRTTYDAAGNRISTTSFAKRTGDDLRAAGSFNALLTNVGTSANDRTSRSVYDGQGLLRFTIDNANRVTEYGYAGAQAGDATGAVRQTTAYARPIAALTTYSLATVTQALANAGAIGDASNRQSFAIRDSSGNLTFAIDAAGAVTGYVYDTSGNVVKTTRFARTYATTTLPTHDAMAAWANGMSLYSENRVTRSYYSARGELRFAIDSMGYVTRYDYDAAGRNVAVARFDNAISGVTDATTIGDIAGWQNGPSVTTATSYDAAGRVFETTDAAGTITRYVYNVNGTLQSTTAAYGTVDQVRTQFTYDAAGRVLTRTEDADGLQSVTRYAYDGFGNLLSQTAPDGTGVTSFTYDRDGQLVTRTDALGQVQSYQYDSFGQRVRSVDERGNATYSYYDGVGRVIAVRDAEDYVTETGYTAFGEIATVTRRAQRASNAAAIGTLPSVAADAKDATTRFAYDKLGRVVRSVDAEGFAENSRYNSFGEVTQATNKLGAVTFRAYDLRGQLVSEMFAKTASDSAEHTRQVVARIDQFDANFYANTYGDLYEIEGDPGKLLAHWREIGWRQGRKPNADFDTQYYLTNNPDVAAAGVNPLDHYAAAGAAEGRAPSAALVAGAREVGWVSTGYAYDARGNLTRKTEAVGLPEQRVTDYSYDALDRLVEKRGTLVAYGLPDRDMTTAQPTEKYLYDRHGNLTRRTDANGRNTFFYYDALDRKVGAVDAAGGYVTYSYDKNGALLRTRAYETPLDVSKLTPEVRPATSGDYRETSYTNDALGRRVSSSIAGVRTGAWDAASGTYLHSTTTLTETIAYDATGNVVRTTDAAGGSILSYYDRLGRRTAQVDQEGFLTEWTLDAEGNALSERRYAVAVADATTAVRPQASPHTDDRVTNFTYDRNGRRLTETRKDVAASTVDWGSGGLVDASGDAQITYSYNALGLVVSKREATGDTTSYRYDSVGRLIGEDRASLRDSVSDPVIPSIGYTYDGLDQLVRTSEAGGGVTTYRYDAMGRKIATVDAMNAERLFFYDRVGNLLAEAYVRKTSSGGSKSEGVSYRYDRAGRLVYQNLATWTASSSGRPISWTNVSDYTEIAYNAFGEVVSRSINNKIQEQNDYDRAGRVWRSTGGDGAWRYYLYDAAGRQTMALESDGLATLRDKALGDVLTAATVDGRLIGGPATGIAATATQYDRRGQVVQVRSLQRELSTGGAGTDLVTGRTYTAFGEVASETDARGATTRYSYNRMGRVTTTTRPVVASATAAATDIVDYRYYDISGRLVGTRDGNGNLLTRILAGGTGYGGRPELVTTEIHADGGRVSQRYDEAGNLVLRTDEVGNRTYYDYDKLGRLVGTRLTGSSIDVRHSYTYDSLGRRLTHSQVGRPDSDRETTDYDIAGRVISSRAFGGDVTTNSYVWDGSITIGLGATGGWRQTTTYANGKTVVEAKDTFGHVTTRTDMGGNVATTSYDQAGRVSEIAGLEKQTFTWLNTGLLGEQTSDLGSGEGVRSVATHGYDAVGNQLWETFTRDGQQYRDTEAAFDLQNRMTSWSERGGANVPAASMAWEFDRNGNIVRTSATRPTLDKNGVATASNTPEVRYFRYDAMNRVTLDGGSMGANGIERGTGTEITYRLDGSRATAVSSVRSSAWIDAPDQIDQSGQHVGQWVEYNTDRRDTYGWREDGQLSSVLSEDTGYIDNGDGTVSSDGSYHQVGSASYGYDAVGRQVSQVDYNEAGRAVYDRSIGYDMAGRGQIVSDRIVALQGSDTVTTTTTSTYGTGTDYMLGAVTSATVTSVTGTGKNAVTTTATTTNSYLWRDGAVLSGTTTTKSGATATNTTYYYSGVSQLDSVGIGGDRQRTVNFVTDLAGQVIRRDEWDTNAKTGDPHEIWYRHGGREIGYVGNNGGAATSYKESIDRRSWPAPAKTDPFSGPAGQVRGPWFAETIDRINSYEHGSAGRGYTVQAGDTLSGIAAQIWGDASLWYKLASANGLGADSVLSAGQVLTIPAGVVRSTYNADSYKPYDPADVLGDVNPVTPTPKGNKCGAFGKILLVVVAAAVTAWIAPYATGFIVGSATGAAATAGAIAAGAVAGAAGSVVSQGVGLATGIQDRFSWDGVATAALERAVGAGVGATLEGSGVVMGTVRAATGSIITQGAAMAVGLRKRFDWVGLAVATVGGGVGSWTSDQLGNALGKFGNRFASGLAGGIAGAATRSILTGTSFGDNVLAVLPDVIGQTIGEAIGDALVGGGDQSRLLTKAGSSGSKAGRFNPSSDNVSGAGQETRVPSDAGTGNRGNIGADATAGSDPTIYTEPDIVVQASKYAYDAFHQLSSYQFGWYYGQAGDGINFALADRARYVSDTTAKYAYLNSMFGAGRPSQDLTGYTWTAWRDARNSFYSATADGYRLRDSGYADWSSGRYLAGTGKYIGSIGLRTLEATGWPLETSIGLVRGHGFYATPIDKQDAAVLSMAAGRLSATGALRGLQAAESEVAQITLNAAKGRAFEEAGIRGILSHVGLGKNTTAVTRNGVTTILDASGRPAGLVEFKDVVNLSSSPQLRAQLAEALATRQPYNLVVSPGNQSISKPLLRQIERVNQQVGGGVYRYDPATDILTPFGK